MALTAKTFAQNLLALQELGDMTWENEIRVKVGDKEYQLNSGLEQIMPSGDMKEWYYRLKVEQ